MVAACGYKREFELSRTFQTFELLRDVIQNGDLTLKTTVSFFTPHMSLAKLHEKSRPDPDLGWKKASFEVPLNRVPK